MDDVRLDLDRLLSDYAPQSETFAGEMLILKGSGIELELCSEITLCRLQDHLEWENVSDEHIKAREAGHVLLVHAPTDLRRPLSRWIQMAASLILKREGEALLVEKDRYGRLGRRYELEALSMSGEQMPAHLRDLPGSSEQILYL